MSESMTKEERLNHIYNAFTETYEHLVKTVPDMQNEEVLFILRKMDISMCMNLLRTALRAEAMSVMSAYLDEVRKHQEETPEKSQEETPENGTGK